MKPREGSVGEAIVETPCSSPISEKKIFLEEREEQAFPVGRGR